MTLPCPATLLPWLAWKLSVDWWNENWPETRKRAAIAASPDIHMKKGTPSAIRKAIESLLARLSLIGETYGAIPVGLSVLSGLETTIYLYMPEDLISHGNIIPAGALQDADRVSVFPLS